jgi:small subunit ribosomal protein S15
LNELTINDASKLLSENFPASHARRIDKMAVINLTRRHVSDVGSMDVQVGILNNRVKYLTTHLLIHKRDHSAKRGLTAVVVARKKFLNYIYKQTPEKALLLAASLGIRFREPNNRWDKSIKYSAFTNTKQTSQPRR